jgi:nickel-dependent lactate racemase
MEIKLEYGKSQVTADIPDGNIGMVLYPGEMKSVDDPFSAVEQSLRDPIGVPALSEIIKKHKSPKVVIVVNDITRPVPYKYVLPPLLNELSEVPTESIELIVATGIHRPHTTQENIALFSKDIVDNYKITNHNCDEGNVYLGELSGGIPFEVNESVYNADVVVATGLIGLHYFAGYSGGRKSIMPGVAGRRSITANHSMMTDPMAKSGEIKRNPVHKIMINVARKVGLDFIVNVVTNSRKEIVKVVSGDMMEAWLEGVKVCGDMSICRIPRKYPVVIAGAGGFPKDIDVYQAQKALEHAAEATLEGGIIILAAECMEGFGEEIFEEWMRSSSCIKDIFDRFDDGFVLGGHKAYAIAKTLVDKEVVLVSSLSETDTRSLFFTYKENLDQAIKYVHEKMGSNFKTLIMPQAALTLPVVES